MNFACGVAMALLVATDAHAQGMIDGLVTDTALVPLAGAAVTVVGSPLRVVTNDNGRFRMLALPAGRYVIVVQKLGYTPASEILSLGGRDTLRPTLALAPVTRSLDTVRVRAATLSARMAEFDARRKSGVGQFMTEPEIRKRNVVVVVDLLRTFLGVRIGNDGLAINRRSPSINGRPCTFQYFIDDIALSPQTAAHLPSPNDLAGIEVYQNTSTIPLRYRTTTGGGFCGVILLWTKDGSGGAGDAPA
jgi:hypothetical protein